MRIVRDDDGDRYVLLERSGEASRVRDPATGNECYVGNDRLEPVDDASVLETTARTVTGPVRRLVTSVHEERSLGLLLELDRRGPTRVRTIVEATDVCESDLHGMLASLNAAGLLAQTTVNGERGYRVTDACERALSVLRGSPGRGSDVSDGDDGDHGDGDTEDAGE